MGDIHKKAKQQFPCRKMQTRLCPALVGKCNTICYRFDSIDPEPWAIELADVMDKLKRKQKKTPPKQLHICTPACTHF